MRSMKLQVLQEVIMSYKLHKLILLLFLLSSLPLISCSSQDNNSFVLPNGLSWDFYHHSCPNVEIIVRDQLHLAFRYDRGLAAGLLRIFFHDCFVQGCDGSVLLTGKGSELDLAPNLTLRKRALDLINHIRGVVEETCGLVVSCADITALAARDSVYLTSGPYFDIPLGRRDSITAAPSFAVFESLPSPQSNVTNLLNVFKKKKFSLIDLVALSGAHTLGISHCSSFNNRMYPNQDPALNPYFAQQLYSACPSPFESKWKVLDVRTPYEFDNKYFINLVMSEGLMTSDQWLFLDRRTKWFVDKFASFKDLFFQKFSVAMVKMSMLEVLTGSEGEIRHDCSVPNSVSAAA